MDPKVNPTIFYLPEDRIHPVEQDENGDCTIAEIEAPFAMTFEVHVCEPFDPRNTIKRRLPNGQSAPCMVRRRYSLARGQRAKIPSCHLNALRTEQCAHEACLQDPLRCRREDHAEYRIVVGGVAPYISIVGEVRPPSMHKAIHDAPADEPAKVPLSSAIEPPKTMTAEQRALERARQRLAAGGGR